MTEPKFCLQCGKEITSKYGKKFCSIKCSALNANKFAAEATRIDKSYACEECGKNFQRKDKRSRFCSHSCAGIHSNRIRYPNQKKPCPDCPKETTTKEKKTYVRTTCSWQCKRSKRITAWLEGKEDFVNKHGSSKILREYLLEVNENKCQDCGYDKKHPNGESILQVHHIDGRWNNTRPENLRLLCPNCHALTENYGGRNRGNGRKWKADYRYAGLAER